VLYMVDRPGSSGLFYLVLVDLSNHKVEELGLGWPRHNSDGVG
jgi:hypothetical protein